MARTKLSVTKALKRKQVNLNNSDINENNVCCNEKKRVVISYPRTKALIKDKKNLSSGCSPLPVSSPLTSSPRVSFNDEIVEIPASPIPYEPNITPPPAMPDFNDSLEAMEVGGDPIEDDGDGRDDDDAPPENEEDQQMEETRRRGKNLEFEFTKAFENHETFLEYWNGGSDLYKNFKKCDKKTTSNGEYTVYRCIFGKKSGYKYINKSYCFSSPNVFIFMSNIDQQK